MRRGIRGFFVSLAGAAVFMAFCESAYFAWMIGTPAAPPPRSCDLFVVFGGVPERVQRGFQLAAGMDARAFTVSDSSADSVTAYVKAYGRPGRAEILLEPNARHTVQNAWFVADMVRSRGFRSVVLATSWYHMPRAGLFMRLALLGSGVTVLDLPTEPVPQRWWAEHYLWAEFPKLWGSLGQWVLGRDLSIRVGKRLGNAEYRLHRLGRTLLGKPERD